VAGDWNDYRFFLAVTRSGTLAGAARALGVDQSTVGRRLGALQRQMGARLLDHTPDGYVLTAAGESILAEVEALERGFLGVERKLLGADARLEGVVRLATSEILATMFLVPHLGLLRERHPHLAVEVMTGNEPVDLARREADVSIRIGVPPKQPNLVVRRIATAGFALYAAQSYLASHGRPRPGRRLEGHQVVCYGGELASTPIGRWATQEASSAEVVVRANSVGAVYEAVAAGLGLGVLPCLLGERALVRVSARPVGAVPLWTVVHEDLVRSARVRAVLDFVAELSAREGRALAGA